MTKAEQRQLDIVKKYHRMGHPDTAARSLSALIRSTRGKNTAAQLRTVAEVLGLTKNPDFIC
jgi:thioredoxin-like negative regulator of GroEL